MGSSTDDSDMAGSSDSSEDDLMDSKSLDLADSVPRHPTTPARVACRDYQASCCTRGLVAAVSATESACKQRKVT